MNRRAVTYGLAAWAAVATLAFGLLWRSKGLPRPLQWFSRQPAAASEKTTDPATPEPAQEAEPPPPVRASMDRYDLCRAQGTPELSLPTLPEQTTIAVHCGATARLLRFAADGPQVLFDFTLSLSPPHAKALPAPLRIMDADGDDKPDLLVGQRYVDEQGNPLSGSIAILRGAERGGFEPPRELLATHPLALFPMTIEQNSTPHLVIVHGRNAHHAHGPELWIHRPDATPPRERRTDLPLESHILGALDVNLDGRDELMLAGLKDDQPGMWIWPPDAHDPSSATFLPLGALNDVAIGDIDGDGHPDALLAGQQLWTLMAREGDPTPTALQDSMCPANKGSCHRDPEILREGTPEAPVQLKSYVHPEVRRYTLNNAAPQVLTLEGRDLAVLDTVTVDVDADGYLDLLVLAHPVAHPQAAQLAVLPHMTTVKQAAFGRHRGALPEDLLHTSDDL